MNPPLNKIFTIIAVVFTTAFFLNGKTKIVTSYINGKVEIIDSTLTGINSISKLELNSSIHGHQIIASAKGSRSEFKNEDIIWRLGSLSVCRWFSPKDCWLNSGSLLLSFSEESQINFSSLKSKATIKGVGTFIVEATSNGGFKIIPLEADGSLSTSEGGTKKIKSGRMLFVLDDPSVFGDAYDIDLLLLLRSSRLINAFPDPLDRIKKIEMAIYAQQLKLKGKFDALIGDANSNENIQIWKFNSSQNEPSNRPKGTINKLLKVK